ncbi:hypothetical protein HF1_08210 [Mycoplasma haemofelis str. Langford 1]|uniref:Uncharacterized protein n=2 Tax=Mycoplasma haemofelis TaxID=29501 RepID=F6FIW0_MYCHI|nr:hypothetical protein [Mycoplasma haemofelis]AEG73158.1 hypothetical protein MHF_0900 [Mycoplasma haemofelis Ohio2]CBY92829.1 hypothetical protein HF1_08210 [Mycoplasma haemofelis str. Langford 1]
MSKTLAAALAGLGTAGVGGGIYLANRDTTSPVEKETLKSKLVKDRYTPLSSSNSDHQTHWDKSLEKYKVKHNNQPSYTDAKLKEMCNGLFEKENIKDEDYKIARKYCVVPRKISERLSDLKIKALSTTGSEDGVAEKWKKLAGEYKNKGTGDKQLNGLTHSTVKDTGDELKNKCGEVFDKEHWEENYDSLLDNAKLWCTEEGFNRLPVTEKQ